MMTPRKSSLQYWGFEEGAGFGVVLKYSTWNFMDSSSSFFFTQICISCSKQAPSPVAEHRFMLLLPVLPGEKWPASVTSPVLRLAASQLSPEETD